MTRHLFPGEVFTGHLIHQGDEKENEHQHQGDGLHDRGVDLSDDGKGSTITAVRRKQIDGNGFVDVTE